MKLWKTIPEKFESRGHKWKMKKWFHVDGEISTCQNGFHASPTILDAMGFVAPGWICRVEVKGESATDSDKSAWSDMMIISRKKWTKTMSMKLAIYAAELVLPIFETEYPNDKRPRKAIDATKECLRKPSAASRAAATDAATDAAWACSDASWAASRASSNASWAARDAASDAARASSDASWAASWAARDAASDAARASSDVSWAASWVSSDASWAAYRASINAARTAKADVLKKIESKIKQLAAIK